MLITETKNKYIHSKKYSRNPTVAGLLEKKKLVNIHLSAPIQKYTNAKHVLSDYLARWWAKATTFSLLGGGYPKHKNW